jgi:hypothetical protein
MEHTTLIVGVLIGVAATCFVSVLADALGKLRLEPPKDAGAIPPQFQQARLRA